MRDQEPILECQDCGAYLKTLSPREQQLVAANPYDYVFYCRVCRKTDHTEPQFRDSL